MLWHIWRSICCLSGVIVLLCCWEKGEAFVASVIWSGFFGWPIFVCALIVCLLWWHTAWRGAHVHVHICCSTVATGRIWSIVIWPPRFRNIDSSNIKHLCQLIIIVVVVIASTSLSKRRIYASPEINAQSKHNIYLKQIHPHIWGGAPTKKGSVSLTVSSTRSTLSFSHSLYLCLLAYEHNSH